MRRKEIIFWYAVDRNKEKRNIIWLRRTCFIIDYSDKVSVFVMFVWLCNTPLRPSNYYRSISFWITWGKWKKICEWNIFPLENYKRSFFTRCEHNYKGYENKYTCITVTAPLMAKIRRKAMLWLKGREGTLLTTNTRGYCVMFTNKTNSFVF